MKIIKSILHVYIISTSINNAFAGSVHNAEIAKPGDACTPVPGTVPAPPDGIINTPIGPALISKQCGFLPLSYNCTLQLTQSISDLGSDLQFEITGGSLTGSGLCSSINLGYSPTWTGTVPHADLPASCSDNKSVIFTIDDVNIQTNCGNCSGSVDAFYSNENGGQLSFTGTLPYTGGGLSGDCSITASPLNSADTNYAIWH